MDDTRNDWIILLARLLLTTVFLQSLHHHLPDYPSWIKALEGWGVPYPQIGAVLADATIFVSVVLLITGWYPRLAVLLLIVFILFASFIGHRFWQMQGPAHAAQYANFTKNFSLIGGVLLYLVTGPGRFVVPGPGSSKR
jgi:putative oxidoreductase